MPLLVWDLTAYRVYELSNKSKQTTACPNTKKMFCKNIYSQKHRADCLAWLALTLCYDLLMNEKEKNKIKQGKICVFCHKMTTVVLNGSVHFVLLFDILRVFWTSPNSSHVCPLRSEQIILIVSAPVLSVGDIKLWFECLLCNLHFDLGPDRWALYQGRKLVHLCSSKSPRKWKGHYQELLLTLTGNLPLNR